MQTPTVVIIGGGVIGCAIAYYLSKQQVKVTLFERREIGSEASGAAAGLLAPLGPLSGPSPFADLVLAGFSQLRALVPELEEESGLQVGYEQTGALRVVRNMKRVPHLKKRLQSWQPLGLQMFWLDGEEVHVCAPLLSPDVVAAIYAPEESQIRTDSLVQAFMRVATIHGAAIQAQQEIVGVVTDRARVVGVKTAQGEIVACSHLVIATGAWASVCNSWFHVSLPVTPLHGQLLSLSQTSPALKHIVFGEAAYVIPRGNQLIVGATKEERGFDSSVTVEGTSWLYTTATRLIPNLAGQQIQATWAGLRPRTPDNHPLIGSLPGWENVSLAVGHNSVGIILSSITGQSIADLITTGQTPQLLRPFSAERFLC